MDTLPAVIQRFDIAMNRHDLDMFLACFDPGYQSEQPQHPDRAFVGTAQVRKNWGNIFSSVPDFHAELVRFAVSDDTAWTEWHWTGMRADQAAFDMRGTIIFGIRNDLIIWGRLYMEPVESGGAGIDAQNREITGRKS
jgi:hypothetical protein